MKNFQPTLNNHLQYPRANASQQSKHAKETRNSAGFFHIILAGVVALLTLEGTDILRQTLQGLILHIQRQRPGTIPKAGHLTAITASYSHIPFHVLQLYRPWVGNLCKNGYSQISTLEIPSMWICRQAHQEWHSIERLGWKGRWCYLGEKTLLRKFLQIKTDMKLAALLAKRHSTQI